MNCTPATPTLSEALAVTVTVPDTVAPAAGAVRLTVGAVVSPPGARPDCWVCGVAAFTCAKVVVDVVVAAASTVTGADSCHGRWVGKGLLVTLITSGSEITVTRPSMVWLVNVGLEGGADASSVTACPNRRLRTNATTAHSTGESTGVVGLSGANGPKPANPSTPNTAPPMVGGVMELGGGGRDGLASNDIGLRHRVGARRDRRHGLRRGGLIHRDIDDRGGNL